VQDSKQRDVCREFYLAIENGILLLQALVALLLEGIELSLGHEANLNHIFFVLQVFFKLILILQLHLVFQGAFPSLGTILAATIRDLLS